MRVSNGEYEPTKDFIARVYGTGLGSKAIRQEGSKRGKQTNKLCRDAHETAKRKVAAMIRTDPMVITWQRQRATAVGKAKVSSDVYNAVRSHGYKCSKCNLRKKGHTCTSRSLASKKVGLCLDYVGLSKHHLAYMLMMWHLLQKGCELGALQLHTPPLCYQYRLCY